MVTKKTSLSEVLKLGKKCQQCGHCCTLGSGFLVGDDIKKISKFLNKTEEELKNSHLDEKDLFNTKLFRPKLKSEDRPYGKCVFLTDKKCKIQEVKPLQCRIGNCNKHGEKLSIWFMLNYLVNEKDPESIRQYAAYLKSGGKTIEGGKLEDLVPDKKRLKEILSFNILK